MTVSEPFKRQSYEMVKHAQKIRHHFLAFSGIVA